MLAASFVREDWTLFRSLDTLSQKAGVPRKQLPWLVLKELVDNAADAVEGKWGTVTAGGLPGNGFYVEDNGPGLSEDPAEVATLFSINRPMVSSKVIRMPTRGALGNGLRVVAGAVAASGGRLCVYTRGQCMKLAPQDDGSTAVETAEPAQCVGTRVEVWLGPSLPVEKDLTDDVDRLLLLQWGEQGYKGKSSPHWYDADSFYELFQAAGSQPVRALVNEMDGCTGRRAGIIAAAFLNRTCASLSRQEAAALLADARLQASRVEPKRLGYVGKQEGTGAGYARTATEVRIDAGHGGLAATLPVVVEAWACRASPDEDDELCVYVNRTPITGDVQVVRQKERTVIGIFGCGLHHGVTVGVAPIAAVVNIQIPYMPITSDGKAPDLLKVFRALEEVLAKAAKRARPRTAAGETPERPRTKKEVLYGLFPGGNAHASGDDRHRYSQRQLLYAVRDDFYAVFGEYPDWNYFCQVLTEYEVEHGDLPNLYRDARGTLYHPHTGDEISLGTIAVERYQRPDWTFNKILYAEKEGFFAILKQEGWPERHDCALLTSKGYASRAARDVIDLLGETDEALTFFCIHDADGPGTGIYQALQQATLARPARKVKIINLGLEPAEALEMGLTVEAVDRKGGGRVPVADYVPDQWREWLQTQRCELNAMTTPQFLDWLDRKMAEHDNGKVVPPAEVLAAKVREETEAGWRALLTEVILRNAGFEEQVGQVLATHEGAIVALLAQVEPYIRRDLEALPEQRWDAPLAKAVKSVFGFHGDDGDDD